MAIVTDVMDAVEDVAEDLLDTVDSLTSAADDLGLGPVADAVNSVMGPAEKAFNWVSKNVMDPLQGEDLDDMLLPTNTYYFLYGKPEKYDISNPPDAFDDTFGVNNWSDAGHMLDRVGDLAGFDTGHRSAGIAAALQTGGILDKPDDREVARFQISNFDAKEAISELYRIEVVVTRREKDIGEPAPPGVPVYNLVDEIYKLDDDALGAGRDGQKDLGDAVDNFLSPITGKPGAGPGSATPGGVAKGVQDVRNAGGDRNKIADALEKALPTAADEIDHAQNTVNRAISDWDDPDQLLKDVSRIQDLNLLPWNLVPIVGSPIGVEDFFNYPVSFALMRRMVDGFILVDRWFTGVVQELEDLGFVGNKVRGVRVVIVPSLSKLGLRRNSRVFQDMSAVQIAEALLDEHGIYKGKNERFFKPDSMLPLGLLGPSKDTWTPKREYCVQYNETDLEFFTRLLGEEGLGFYFDHSERRERIIITENPTSATQRIKTVDEKPVANRVPEAAAMNKAEICWAFLPKLTTFTDKVRIRDFNYGAPDSTTEKDAGYPTASLSSGLNMPSFSDITNFAKEKASGIKHHGDVNSEYYEYQSRFVLEKPEDPNESPYKGYGGVDVADRAMKALRTPAEVWRGDSNVIGLLPGIGVRIRDFLGGPDKRPEKGAKFLLVRVRHTYDSKKVLADGSPDPLSYTNRFWCIDPKKTPWYPLPFGKRPTIDGLQTAIVVGKGGEVVAKSGDEIHVDRFGRVQVRFHWDRRERGRDAGKAVSCWVRVATPMAGPDHGHVFIPRVGMEVAVAFADGNPDRPLVMGAVYNGPHQTNNWIMDWKGVGKTHAGFRTASVPTDMAGEHPERYNELIFEDGGGREEIKLRAQRDLTEETLNDHRTEVDENQYNTVKNDQTEEVKGNQTLEVKSEGAEADRHLLVGGDETVVVQKGEYATEGRHETVGGNETIVVGGDRTDAVHTTEVITVKGEHEETPPQYTRALKVHGARETTISQNDTLDVTGNKVDKVKGALTVKAAQITMGAAPEGKVGEPKSKNSGMTMGKDGVAVDSQGEVTLRAGQSLKIRSNESNGRVTFTAKDVITLSCGKQVITIHPDQVTIASEDGDISFACGTNTLTVSEDKITLESLDPATNKKATVTLDASLEDNQDMAVDAEMMTLDFKGEIHFSAKRVGAN